MRAGARHEAVRRVSMLRRANGSAWWSSVARFARRTSRRREQVEQDRQVEPPSSVTMSVLFQMRARFGSLGLEATRQPARERWRQPACSASKVTRCGTGLSAATLRAAPRLALAGGFNKRAPRALRLRIGVRPVTTSAEAIAAANDFPCGQRASPGGTKPEIPTIRTVADLPAGRQGEVAGAGGTESCRRLS